MSSSYHIYGMGNALVDFEIETTTAELANIGVEKGVMTLIEEDRQHQLFEAFHGKQHHRACGGSAANTIIGAQTLGSQCFYSCKVAADEAGHFYRDDLLGHGVNSNLAEGKLVEGVTGKCLVLVSEDADRTMNTFLGVTGDIDYQQVDEKALSQSEWLYIEGYLSSSPRALEAAVQAMSFARKQGVKTAFSLSDPNMVRFCRDGLSKIIGEGVDLLFCNQDEALEFTGLTEVSAAATSLAELAATVVITLGAEGSLIVDKGQHISIDGHAVEAVDTNGAGDLFAGSFLHALAKGANFETAGKLASFASAKLVTEFGPRLKPQKLDEVKAFAQQLLA